MLIVGLTININSFSNKLNCSYLTVLLFTEKQLKIIILKAYHFAYTHFLNRDSFFAKKKGERVILMTTKAKTGLDVFKFKKNDTMLFGRETAGVPDSIHKKIKNKIKIPMIKEKRSLNIAVSVAITLSENLRQTKWIMK